jgi:hypothetical protein
MVDESGFAISKNDLPFPKESRFNEIGHHEPLDYSKMINRVDPAEVPLRIKKRKF